MFKNAFNPPDKVKSKTGEKVRSNYKPVYKADGGYDLVADGYINSYDDIQSHADSCDMGLIMERYRLTGDSSVFNQRNGFYADVTGFPGTYAEMQNAIIQANNEFMALPIDIREQFGQDPSVFYAQFGSPEWMSIMGYDKPVEVPEKKEGDVSE